MRYLIFIAFLLTVIASNAQSLTDREIHALSDCIMKPLSLNDSFDFSDQKPEYIICMLKVDSLGKIVSKNVLADPENIGSMFKAVSSIPLSAFEAWTVPNAKNQTIIFPMVSIPRTGCAAYMADLAFVQRDNSIRHKILYETPATITLTALHFFKPEIKY